MLQPCIMCSSTGCVYQMRCSALKERSRVPVRHLNLLLRPIGEKDGRKEVGAKGPAPSSPTASVGSGARASQLLGCWVTIAPFPASVPLPYPVQHGLAWSRGQVPRSAVFLRYT